MVSGVGHLSGKEKTMSLYDTIRCLKYDPAFLLEHYDGAIGALGVLAVLALWWAV